MSHFLLLHQSVYESTYSASVLALNNNNNVFLFETKPSRSFCVQPLIMLRTPANLLENGYNRSDSMTTGLPILDLKEFFSALPM